MSAHSKLDNCTVNGIMSKKKEQQKMYVYKFLLKWSFINGQWEVYTCLAFYENIIVPHGPI